MRVAAGAIVCPDRVRMYSGRMGCPCPGFGITRPSVISVSIEVRTPVRDPVVRETRVTSLDPPPEESRWARIGIESL